MALLILILRILAIVLVFVGACGVNLPRVNLAFAGIGVWMVATLLEDVHV